MTISVSMTPAFYDPEHMLLRAQLKCLSLQTVKDFDVWLIDPHYRKRKDVIPELAQRFKLDIKHVPYTPNTRIAKLLDCSIFNAGYLFSSAEINVRYSCYRFARPTLIEAVLEAPPNVNVDFHWLSIGPDLIEDQNHRPFERHKMIWNFESEDVNWEAVPSASGYEPDGSITSDGSRSLARWPRSADHDVPEGPVPMNLYGNIAWHRCQWFEINGTNEVFTNSQHWEDLDFDCRAAIAGHTVVRKTHLLYRLHHDHGTYSQRSNAAVDTECTRPCGACLSHHTDSRNDDEYCHRLRTREVAGEISFYEDASSWVCETCSLAGPLYREDGMPGYFARLRKNALMKAPIVKSKMIGRNLTILANEMDRSESLLWKVTTFVDSWNNPKYYES